MRRSNPFHLTRRDFLKIAGLGAALPAAWAGLDAAVDFLGGELPSGGTFATTCSECPAGCGLLVDMADGYPLRIHGNPAHPLNRGAVCPRGLGMLDRWRQAKRQPGPLRQAGRTSGDYRALDWESAVAVVGEALSRYASGEVAFLLGLFPDHLADVVNLLSNSAGGMNVLRYGAPGRDDGQLALLDAAHRSFGAAKIPTFDLQNTELILSFGADFSETWLAPAGARRGGGYLVLFDDNCSPAAARVSECVAIAPGSHGLLALTLGRLVLEAGGIRLPPLYAALDPAQAAWASGVNLEHMQCLARRFLSAGRKIALPGVGPLNGPDGVANGRAILALNLLARNSGWPGGLALMPDAPLYPALPRRPASSAELWALVERMHAGQIKVLFVHGVDPLNDFPPEWGFANALCKVERVISLSSSPGVTGRLADYLFPDRHPLEAWGYQYVIAGGDRPAISGLQPVIPPQRGSRPAVDLLLAAACDGVLAKALPFGSEAGFLLRSLFVLSGQGGCYAANDPVAFFDLWRQHGGWWKATPGLLPPVALEVFDQPLPVEMPA